MKDILAKLDELTKRKKLTESQNVSEQLDRNKVKEAEWDYNPFKDGSAQDYGHEGDTEDYIIKLWNQGMDVKEIAAELDADLQLVKDTVDKYEASDSYDDEPDIDDPAHDELYARNRFAEPGSGSALHAADETNPRSYPCPSCERENMLTKKDVMKGYQCDRCADAAEGYRPQYESKKGLKDYINEASVEHDKNKEVEEAVRLGFVRDKEFTRPTNPSQRRALANKAKEIRGTARFLKKKGKEMRARYDDPESLGPDVELPQAGLASIAKSPDAPFKNVAVAVTGPSKREHSLYKPKVMGSRAGKMMGEAEQIEIKPASQKTQVITQGNQTLGTVTNPALADQIKRAIGKGEMSLAGKKLGEADDHSSLEPVMSFQTRDDDESMDYHRMADVYKQGEDYVVLFKTQAPGMRAPSPLRTTDISQAEKAARKYTGNDQMNEAKKVKNPYAVGMAVAKKAAGITAKHAKDLPKKVIKKAHKIAKEIKEAEIPGSQVDLGAGLGAGRSRSVLESPMDEPVIINTPEGIKYVQMAAARGAINLEKKGLRHSKIGSVKNKWAKHLGMRPRATHDEVIAELEKRMQEIKDNLSETKISKAVKAGKKVAKDIEYDEKVKDKIHGKKRHAEDEKAERAGKKVTKDLEYDMKKSTKKKVKESMNPQLKAAYQEGYAHGLREQSCRVKHYENMEEAKKYYEGYKCGLDECYGMMPVQGLVVGESDTYMDEMSMPATVPGMASQAMGENLSQVGISDDLAAKKITDKLKGTPGITANNIDRHVSRYLGMVGKQPTDLKHLSVLVFNNLEALGLAESEYGTLDEMMLHDDELNEMMHDLEEMSRGEYISHMDKKAEHAGKDTFSAFGQEFDTEQVDEMFSFPVHSLGRGMKRMPRRSDDPLAKRIPGQVARDPRGYRDVVRGVTSQGVDFNTDATKEVLGNEYSIQKGNRPNLPETEQVKDPNSAYKYAKDVIQGRWPEAEAVIAKDPSAAYGYAKDIIQGRFPAGEAAIARHPRWAHVYAKDVIRGRWPEGEAVNDMFESLDKQLNDLLNEGLSVSVSTGQPGMQGDSVSVNATDDDAAQLLDFVKKVGLGGLSAEEKHEEPAVAVVHSDYGAPSHQPDDRTSMLALMKKMNGEDYEQESDEGSCGCEAVSEMETDGQREFQVAEDAAEDAEVKMTDHDEDAEAKEDEALAINNIEEEYGSSRSKPIYKGPEGTLYRVSDADTWKKLAAGTKWDVGMIEMYLSQGPIYVLDVPNVNKYAVHLPSRTAIDAMGRNIEADMLAKIKKLIGSGSAGKGKQDEELTEWANDAGKKGTDEAFEADIDFMTNVITAGLNGRKSTGQTTVPVIAGQTARTGADSFHESKGSIAAWQKLCGIR